MSRMTRNATRNTFRTASAVRNPGSTAAAGILVGGPLAFFGLLFQICFWGGLLIWWSLKITVLVIYGLILLVSKGSDAAAQLYQKSRREFAIGRDGQAEETQARPRRTPGVWYADTGVVPKDRN